MIELPPGITDKMWWAMCEFHLDIPLPLGQADLSKPFVYERRWGVMYCPMSMHQGAMSLLLAFQHGLTCGIDIAEKLGIGYSDETADHWLQHTHGAAFRSSNGKRIQVATLGGLTIKERRVFGDVNEVFKD